MEKTNKNIKVFLYISIWVIIWGSLASLIDFPLLQKGIYHEGELGQYLTFSISAILSIFSAKNIFKRLKL